MSRPGPGKYEGNTSLEVSLALESYVNSGLHQEEFGEVDSYGWFGLVVAPQIKGLTQPVYIIEEDNFGFFSYMDFIDKREGLAYWQTLIEEFNIWDNERMSEQKKYLKKKGHDKVSVTA